MDQFSLENEREWAYAYTHKGQQTHGMIKCSQDQGALRNFIILTAIEQNLSDYRSWYI